jgi:hypothetical protein
MRAVWAFFPASKKARKQVTIYMNCDIRSQFLPCKSFESVTSKIGKSPRNVTLGFGSISGCRCWPVSGYADCQSKRGAKNAEQATSPDSG